MMNAAVRLEFCFIFTEILYILDNFSKPTNRKRGSFESRLRS